MLKNSILSVILFVISSTVLAEKLTFVTASKSEFAHPHDLSLGPNNKYLYVTDMNHDVIKVLDPDSLKTLATIGEGELSVPHDVTFDHKGRMLVADSGNDRIAIYSVNGLSGKLIAEIDDSMSSPEGVTSDSDNNIYVANAGNNKILLFQNGRLTHSSGGFGRIKGKFHRAHDIEYFQGKLYAADPGNNRIQILNEQLNTIKIFKSAGQQFNEPKYLALDTTGRLYVGDQHNNMLRVFNTKGEETHRVTSADGKALNKLEGVEVYNNKVWLSDTYNDRIVLFRWE